MTFTIEGKLKDTLAFLKSVKIRKKVFRFSSHINRGIATINKLSNKLHPDFQECYVDDIIQQTDYIKTIRLKCCDDHMPAYFRAGQYIVLETQGRGLSVSRPYTLSCSPQETLTGRYYEITVKEEQKGIVSHEIVRSWEKGQKVAVSEPMGQFHYSSIRDKKQLLCFAGGTGITPFRSIVPQILKDFSDIRIVLFFGFNSPEDFLFRKEFMTLKKDYPNRFSIIPVAMNPGSEWTGKTGLITRDLILEYVSDPGKYSWFICGPQKMKDSIKEYASSFSIPRKQLRYEKFTPDLPDKERIQDKIISITVHRGEEVHTVQGSTGQTIVQALEAAGLNPPAYCRSGECGWCRSKLVKGSVFVPESVEGVRIADKTFGYIHTCCSYPQEDCELIVNPNPLHDLSS